MAGVIGVWSRPYPYGRGHRGMVPAIGVFLKVVLSENSILDVDHAVFTQKTFKKYPYCRGHRSMVRAIPLWPGP